MNGPCDILLGCADSPPLSERARLGPGRWPKRAIHHCFLGCRSKRVRSSSIATLNTWPHFSQSPRKHILQTLPYSQAAQHHSQRKKVALVALDCVVLYWILLGRQKTVYQTTVVCVVNGYATWGGWQGRRFATFRRRGSSIAEVGSCFTYFPYPLGKLHVKWQL